MLPLGTRVGCLQGQQPTHPHPGPAAAGPRHSPGGTSHRTHRAAKQQLESQTAKDQARECGMGPPCSTQLGQGSRKGTYPPREKRPAPSAEVELPSPADRAVLELMRKGAGGRQRPGRTWSSAPATPAAQGGQ